MRILTHDKYFHLILSVNKCVYTTRTISFFWAKCFNWGLVELVEDEESEIYRGGGWGVSSAVSPPLQPPLTAKNIILMGAAGSVQASGAPVPGRVLPQALNLGGEAGAGLSQEISRHSSALVQMSLRQESFTAMLHSNRTTTKEEFLRLGEELFRRRVGEGLGMDERLFVEYLEELLSQYRLGGNEIKPTARNELSQGLRNILFVRDNCRTATWTEVQRVLVSVADDLSKFHKYYDGRATT